MRTERTPGEWRTLCDVVQIAAVIAGLVVLALPWWTYVSGSAETGYDDHTLTGWAALGSSSYGEGWLLIIAAAVTTFAIVLPQRWAPAVGAVVAAVAALFILVGAPRLQSVGVDDARFHAGLWVGFVLILIMAANQVGVAALRRRPEAAAPTAEHRSPAALPLDA